MQMRRAANKIIRVFGILIFFISISAHAQERRKEEKKKSEKKAYEPSFTVYTLRGPVTFDTRYSKFRIETSFDSKYTWFSGNDARYYGGKLGCNIRRVTRLGYSFYSFLGGSNYREVEQRSPGFDHVNVMSWYQGCYLERSVIVLPRTELSLGGSYGTGRLRFKRYVDSGKEYLDLEKLKYHYAEAYMQGTLRATYFMTLTGGIGYRWALPEKTEPVLTSWVNSPCVNFSVGISVWRMFAGIFSQNIREVY
jgi:hypothetical protein